MDDEEDIRSSDVVSCDDIAEQRSVDDSTKFYQPQTEPVSVQDGEIATETASSTYYPLEKDSIDVNSVSKDLETRDMILSDLLTTDQDVNTWTGVPTLAILQAVCYSVRKLKTVNISKTFLDALRTDRVILTMTKIEQNLTFAAYVSHLRVG